MKKRLLSIALCLCMVLTLLPTMALATNVEHYESWEAATAEGVVLNNGDQITIVDVTYTYDSDVSASKLALSDNNTILTNRIYKSGMGYSLWKPVKTIGYPSGEGQMVTNGKLTLNNASVKAIALPLGVTVELVVEGENSVNNTDGAAIEGMNIALSVTGDGTLNLSGAQGIGIGIYELEQNKAVPSVADTVKLNGSVYYNTFDRAMFFTVCGKLTAENGWSINSGEYNGSFIVAKNATLAVPNGVTLNLSKASSIDISGTIVNNGTIQLPTGSKIEALNITGRGIVQVKKAESDEYDSYINVDKTYYLYGGDISTTGLDLGVPPEVPTYYTAGDGYALFTPAVNDANAKLLLSNATIDTTASGQSEPSYAISLPIDITVDVVGNCIIRNNKSGAICAVKPLLITGAGTLKTFGNYSITADELTIGGNVSLDTNSGFARCASITTNTTGKVNAIVQMGDDDYNFDYSVYGDVILTQSIYVANGHGLTVTDGVTLTIGAGGEVYVSDGAKPITIGVGGKIVNNGIIMIAPTYAKDIPTAIKALNLTGIGVVLVYDDNTNIYTCYSNSGEERPYLSALGGLDRTDNVWGQTRKGEGYDINTTTVGETVTVHLKLDRAVLMNDGSSAAPVLEIPADVDTLDIVLVGPVEAEDSAGSIVNKSVDEENNNTTPGKTDVTIGGTGTLSVAGATEIGGDLTINGITAEFGSYITVGGKLTMTDGAVVTLMGGRNYGGVEFPAVLAGDLSGIEDCLPEGYYVGNVGIARDSEQPQQTIFDADDNVVLGRITLRKAAAPSIPGGITAYNITAKAGANGTISPSGNVYVSEGESKTFEIKANEGYAIKDALVDGVSVGAVDKYTFEKVGKAHTISATFCKVYKDVKGDDWFKDEVDFVTDKGLMNGTGDGNFSPYVSTTRGMIVTVLYRMENSPAVTHTDIFDDVAEGTYYHDAVLWAAENKIVNGYGNGKFGPEDNITREQLVTTLWRYAGSPKSTADLSAFADAGSISDYAKEAMAWAVEIGLVQGSDGKLMPASQAKRCEVAAILMRYCEKTEK